MQVEYEKASEVTNDAIGNIRTVASFCAEEKVMEMYRNKCEGPTRSGIKQGLISGIGFGLSISVLFLFYATSFYAGARLVEDGKATFSDVFQVSKEFIDNYLVTGFFPPCTCEEL